MQFEYNHKIGQNVVSVKFEHNLNFKAENTFNMILMRLGGEQITIFKWEFPVYITSQVIEQVIRNFCYNCGGLMQDGEAIVNDTFRSIEEEERGGFTTFTDPKYAHVKKVRKCQSCGHSHTI